MKVLLITALCIAATAAQYYPSPYQSYPSQAKTMSMFIVNDNNSLQPSFAYLDFLSNFTAYKFPSDGLCLIHKGTPTANDTNKYKTFDVPEESSNLSAQQVGPTIAAACSGMSYKFLSNGTTIEPTSRHYGRRMGRCSYYYGSYYYAYPVYYPIYIPIPVPAPPPPPAK